MKQFYFLIMFLLVSGAVSAQEKLTKEEQQRREKNIQAANPFAQYGYKGKVATLSKGKYLEVHDLDSIVTIGSVRFHVDRKEIVGFVAADTVNGEYARPIGDMPSRWLSVDPLAEEFPEWSPYTFSFNNPIRYVDPDGRAPLDWFKNQQGRVVWFDNSAKSFTDTGGNNWTNIGATTSEVKQSLRVPNETQTSNWGTLTGALARGKDGAGANWGAINVRHFENSAQVNYDLDIKNTGAAGELVSGRSEITGVKISATVSSETNAPGTIITGVSGNFSVDRWSPLGKTAIFESSPFQDYKGPMLSNYAAHGTSNASAVMPLGTYNRLTNTNPPSIGLDLNFNTSTVTKDQLTGKQLIFDTSK